MSFYLSRGSRVYAPDGRGSRVQVHARGRICAVEHCATILSAYNPSRFCSLHDRQDPVRRQSARSRPVEERTCPQCGHFFQTTNPKRRFCSDRCRMAAFQVRRKRAESGLIDAG